MTVGHVIAMAREALGRSPAFESGVERQVWLQYAHSAIRRTLERYQAQTERHTITLSTGTHRYLLPPNLFTITGVFIDGIDYTSQRVPAPEIDLESDDA